MVPHSVRAGDWTSSVAVKDKFISTSIHFGMNPLSGYLNGCISCVSNCGVKWVMAWEDRSGISFSWRARKELASIPGAQHLSGAGSRPSGADLPSTAGKVAGSLLDAVHHADVSPILALAHQNIQARLPWCWLLPDGHAIKLNAGSFSCYAAS